MDEALKLLAIGMSTVFTTLLIVVIVGNLIIRFVNKFIPEAVVVKAQVTNKTVTSAIGSNKLAAIVSAIDIVTNGKGKVTSVERK